ncbi:MAG TPA: sodium:glutamate symporter, partial [Bacteroidetes bacterium]|nr:sodium:glutamate symporter [Bacteroidota bacterium]
MEQIIFKLDMIQTLALAAVVLFIGYAVRRRVPVLDKYNIPAAVVGGFLFAAVALAVRLPGWVVFQFDTGLQAPLMIAFFTTIGLGANLKLLKIGGPQVLMFWVLATVLVVMQDGVGVLLAHVLGVHPFLGLIAGSITMTGGHGTGAAFGKLMEDQYAFSGALTLAMAAATFGLVSGGLIGGPVATALIKRFNPKHQAMEVDPRTKKTAAEFQSLDTEIDTEPSGEAPTAFRMLKVITIILAAMWIGSLLSGWIGRYFTLPAYIGAMLVAAVFCNGAGAAKIKIEQRVVDDLGTIALSLFLSMALMSLKLWELLDLAVPMLVILTVQVSMMAAYAYFV